ncbi:MAG: pyridoxal-phosphate dependent enzyme [Candidatus Eisenbacteria bacterium]|nr:pyridoxal-phosphate dependent enzyme [Candidatus Eisenbacteria bacterium]
MGSVTFEDILAAARRIAPYAHRTPVLTSSGIDGIVGAQLFFKCENFQRVGAFKFRGASNAVFSLADEIAARGVLTHSSGNHAAALALSSRLRGIPATVVMPSSSPAVKRAAVEGYGARIVICEPTLASREATAERVRLETGGELIHPYDNDAVIAGQGTAALELMEEVPDLDLVLAPVGGGGLASGTGVAVAGASPATRVIGVEPAGADDAFRSLQAGRIIPQTDPHTIADGLRTSLAPRTFDLIRRHLTGIVTVEEEEIIAAMRLIWERMKIVIEPSSAVPFAALLARKVDLPYRRAGVILSGGNVDLDHLPWAK